MSGYDYISAITGCTTDVPGRFALRGPAFELLADGSVASGGPGRAPGPLDLMVAALASNLLNVLSVVDGPDPEVPESRIVQVRARTSRYPSNRLKAGRLVLDVVVADLDAVEAERLLDRYRAGCRILPAVSLVLDVVINAVGAEDVAA